MNADYEAQLLALPSKERLEIALVLFKSVSNEADEHSLSPEWLAEIERRIEHMKKHPEDAIPWEDVLDEFESKLKAVKERA